MRNILWLLLGVMTWLQASAQFNPPNPDEPEAPPVTYLLKVRGIPDGAASYLTPSSRREAGTRVSLSTSAATGFVFVRWEDADGNVLSEESSFSYVMPEHDALLTARFAFSPGNPSEPDEPVDYAQLSLSVSPPEAGTVSGGGKFEVGSIRTVSTSPNTSYQFQDWTRDGEVISTERSFGYEVRKGTNHLVANYAFYPGNPDDPSTPEIRRKLYLKANPPEYGSVSPASGSTFLPGQTVTVQASAHTSYAFVNWTTEDGEALSPDSRYDFTMPDANTTLVANFRYAPGNPDDPGVVSPRRNVIYGGRISVSPGSEVFYDINLENVDALNGINIDVTMPEGFVADYTRAVMTNRTQGHTFNVEEVDAATRRIVIRGAGQIDGGSGAVIRIPVRVPEDVEYGVSIIVPLTHGVVANGDGTLSPVDAIDGIIKIADELIVPDSPDFVITEVLSDDISVMPGDALHVAWKVANKGSLAATGGWSETISLVNSANKRLALSTVYYETASLGVGEEVSRSATVGIPEMPGIDGALDVRIDLTPFVTSGEIDEYQLNNTAQTSGSPVSLGKRLIAELPANVAEELDGSVRCTLRRSGDWSKAETFTISKTPADDRLEIPATVTIRKDQSEAHFMIYVRDNNVLDENSVVTVEVSGNGYEPVSGEIAIEDNEFAGFEVVPSKDEVVEGETFDIVITIPKPAAGTVAFKVVSDHPARFRHPSTAEIAAGSTTATITVNTVDDDEIQLTEPVEFTVSADNYQNQSCVVEIMDNDMPEMELTLTPSEVQEDAGPAAVTGVLRRLSNTDKKVVIKLSDNSPSGDIYYPYKTLTMEKGTESIEFPLGVNNNSVVDGDRRIEITAAVYVQSCGCSPTGTNAGSVNGTLTVIDDDGPALSLRSSGTSLVEGDSKGIMLTVTRNTDISDVCTVRLSSDWEEGLSFPKEVTMAKGEGSATVKVVAEANDVTDDSRTIVFAAECPGYSKGICHVILTDRTLPDAVISGISLSASEGEANEELTATVTLRNDGAAPLQDAAKVSFYFGNAPEPAGAAYTPQALNPGESISLSKSIALPSAVGVHEVYAVVNELKTEKELLYTNNISGKVTVNVLSPFRATLSADRTAYQRGDSVELAGHVEGKVAEGDEVEVYVINDGLRQAVSAKVDASGDFSAVYAPYSAQIGHFTAGACYPGEGLDAEMASFDVLGMRTNSKAPIRHETVVGETVSGTISLTNPTSVALTGVRAAVASVPDNIEVSFKCPSSIGAGQTVEMEYSLKGTQPSPLRQWDIVKIQVVSDEGASYDGAIYVYCKNATGKLVADIEEIRTTMTYAQPREYSFTITNVGKGATGAITLSLPEWMKPLTPRQMPSLAADETADIVLQLTPSDRMQLNVPVTGQIGVNCENGEGFPLRYSVEPVSEATGTLVIDVCDEYTYYTEAAPHVRGAEVTVMHPVSHAVLAKGETNDSGIYSLELPEGYYAVKVTCPRHESYQRVLLVDPGRTTKEIVNLGVSGVAVTYSVEETDVEDEYTVVTNYTYSTDVPVPVVVTTQDREVNGQDLAVGESVIVNITVTNEGLITAKDFEFGEPVASDDWELTFLGYTGPFDLYSHHSYTIPMKVTRVKNTGASDDGNTSDSNGDDPGNNGNTSDNSGNANNKMSPCLAAFNEYYKHHCDKDLKMSVYTYGVALQICAHSNALYAIISALSDKGEGDVPSGGNSDYYYGETTVPVVQEPLICDEDAVVCADQIVKGLAENYPGMGKITSISNSVGEKYSENKINNENSGNPEAPTFTRKDGIEIITEFSSDEVIGYVDQSGLYGPAKSGLKMYLACWKYIEKKQDGNKVISRTEHEYSETDKVEAYLRQWEIVPQLLLELYGDEVWYVDNINASMDFLEYASSLDEEAITFENLLPHKPAHISESRLAALLERVSDTNPENYIDWDHFLALAEEMSRIESDAREMGYESAADMYEKTLKDVYADLSDPEGSVCSKVKLQISQSMVMTRQAFCGTLSVSNGSADTPISNFSLVLDIRDKDGNVATSHEFQTALESMSGFTGASTLDGPWSLDPKQDGVAQILFIPTRYAAETEPQDYTFSGVIHYTDPYTGLNVTRSLSSTTLTVTPSPVLDLTYFMQRDVIGDDPFTKDIEPSIPGEFALVIDNVGYGDANNVRITTQQPQIIENEKGLFVDFELIGSQLNGEAFNLSFGKAITSDFGTIPARSSAYAQWWLKCNLAGFFDDYDVKVNHVTSYGNEDLSLLNEATIHELVHGFSIDNESGFRTRGFLVNDVMDSAYLPDIVYFSDGTEAREVSSGGAISIEANGENEYVVTVNPTSDGWTYGSIADPTGGRQAIVSVTRLSDGADIPVDNFWQTPYILRKNSKPLHEPLLHVVANQTGAESYGLVFAPRPDLELAVEAFGGVPDAGEVMRQPLKTVDVTFNKEIDPATFTGEDLTLYNQGRKLDVSGAGISSVGSKTYRINLDGLTSESGLYVLTVNTDGITDADGFAGVDGSTVTWIQDINTGMSAIEADRVSMYPLPMRQNVYISGIHDTVESVEFYDSNGILRLISRNIEQYHPVDVSMLPPGVYIVRISTDTGVHIVKATKK